MNAIDYNTVLCIKPCTASYEIDLSSKFCDFVVWRSSWWTCKNTIFFWELGYLKKLTIDKTWQSRVWGLDWREQEVQRPVRNVSFAFRKLITEFQVKAKHTNYGYNAGRNTRITVTLLTWYTRPSMSTEWSRKHTCAIADPIIRAGAKIADVAALIVST